MQEEPADGQPATLAMLQAGSGAAVLRAAAPPWTARRPARRGILAKPRRIAAIVDVCLELLQQRERERESSRADGCQSIDWRLP